MRARLALDAQGIPYRAVHCVPAISEPALRLRLWDFRGRISVPVLLPEDGPPVRESFEIAAWGAARSARPLITADNREGCERTDALSNRALEAGRARTTRLVYDDAAALRESMPPAVAALGPLGRAIGRNATWDLLRKYGAEGITETEALAQLRGALLELRGAIAGREWLLGEFSYADVTGAMALGFVSPHARAPLGPASRPLWTVESLAAEFADLVAFRDRVVDEVRRRRKA
ncbi:MAG: glutathione S-transferase domain-containing protein [Deltaproteobacteria bacterium]|nr:glutathione S-transferase domain-containing protein [Deltaproteobacteria bacterium]